MNLRRRPNPLDQRPPITTSRDVTRAIDDVDKAVARILKVADVYELPSDLSAAFTSFGAAARRMTAAMHSAYIGPKERE